MQVGGTRATDGGSGKAGEQTCGRIIRARAVRIAIIWILS